MAVDILLKIAGIDGESVIKEHEKEVDILSWSWGASNHGSMHTGTGGGAGKVDVSDLSVTKYVDTATSPILLAVCNGKHVDSAILCVRKAGEKPLDYLIITMTDVFFTGYSTGGSGGQDRITETVSMNFAKVKVEYFSQDKTGKKQVGPTMTWNIATNADS